MKKFLFTALSLTMATAVLFWARTGVPHLPWVVYLYDAGRLLGLIGFVLLTFQYVLSSKIHWIEKGIGLDRLLAVHRSIGLLVLPFLTAHPLVLLLSERLQGYASPIGFLKVLGMIALALVWVTAGIALPYGRLPFSYETWKRGHRIGYALLPIGFIHSFFMGTTLHLWPMRLLWATLILIYLAILFNNGVRCYRMRKHPFRVTGIHQETHDIWCLQMEGDHSGYAPGQFLFVQIEQGGKPSAPHPFTIASSPDHHRLSICVKSVGDFTGSIAATTPSSRAYVDMPYGVFSFVRHEADRWVFIAGGIGITPFLSMLRYMRDRRLQKEVILLWANKREADIAFRNELDIMASEMPGLKVYHILSRQTDWPGEKGHIDDKVLRRCIGDVTAREYFVCGPPPMMDTIRKLLVSLGVSKRHVHAERFALR